MRSKKLKVTLYQLMFAGCIGAAFSSQALAANYVYPHNGYALPKQAYTGYRFRPVERFNEQHQLRRHFSYAQAARALHQARLYHGSTRIYRQFRHAAPLQHRSGIPAFARQYAWSTAQPKGFRRGGSENFYANQSNEQISQSAGDSANTTALYQSSAVSTQGFRYRTISRNTNYVSFSDRVKAFKPVNFIAPAAPFEQKPVPVRVPAVKSVTPKPASNSYDPGKSLLKSGNYRFRPDLRFQPEMKQEVVQQISVDPVNYKLANAELPATVDNPWNDWSFRPADSTF